MAELGELKPKIKKKIERTEGIEVKEVPKKRIEPEVIEEQKAREELERIRAIEEEKRRLKELEREESRERFRAIEEEEKRLEELESERILKEGKRLEEKEKKRKERVEVIKKIVELPEQYKHLIGDDSLVAWADREEMPNPIDVAKSLAGVASELSREWLDQHKEDRRLWKAICEGLMVDDSPEAWETRDWLEVDPKKNRLRGGRWATALAKLGLHKSESLFKLREKSNLWLYGWPGFYLPGDLIMSTTGISLDESERKRQLLEKYKYLAPAETLISLAGDTSQEANELREKYKGDRRLNWAYKKSLIGTELEKKEKYEKS